MPETAGTGLKLGQKVPDFEIKTYEPTRRDFGAFRLVYDVPRATIMAAIADLG